MTAHRGVSLQPAALRRAYKYRSPACNAAADQEPLREAPRCDRRPTAGTRSHEGIAAMAPVLDLERYHEQN